MKKAIRLTESGLKDIIKRVISERLGVPDNITEVANNVYSGILWFFPENYDLNSQDKSYHIYINDTHQIADYTINRVSVTISITEHPSVGSPDIMGAAVKGMVKLEGYKLIRQGDDEVDITYNIVVPPGGNWNLGTIMDYFKDNRPQMESMLAHEFMHKYEHYKNPVDYVSRNVRYNSFQNFGIANLPPFNHFMHLLYFAHEAERQTRPSEVYSRMKSQNITKENFKEFVKENDVFVKLREARDFTFGKFIGELHNHMPAIDEFLKFAKDEVDYPIRLDGTDMEKIADTLKIVHTAIPNIQVNDYFETMKKTMNPFLGFMSPEASEQEAEEKQKYFDDFEKRAKKYKKPRDFFENEIKIVNFVGNKTIKKLAKLYDMLDDKDESIVNWDLHQKINKTGEKTKMKLQELLKSPNPKIIKKKG